MYTLIAAWGQGPFWDNWPFTPGYGDFYSTLAKFALVAIYLGIIAILLRTFYGPNGIFRDKDLDREAEETRRANLEKLELTHAAGEISDLDYTYQKKNLLK